MFAFVGYQGVMVYVDQRETKPENREDVLSFYVCGDSPLGVLAAFFLQRLPEFLD